MSLKKRGRIWHCKWIIGGKEITESTGTADRQAAQEYHDRRRADLWRETKLGDRRTITWDEAALAWIEEHATHKRSFDTDQQRLRWLTDELTGRPVTEITTEILLGLRRKQLDAGNAPATSNRYLAVVSAVLNHAHDKGELAAVPSIPYLPEDSADFFLWLRREQAVALLSELPPHLAAMVRFDLATGLRRGNVTGLQWTNIDIERRVTWVWARTAKGKKHFAVPLNDDAMAVLAAQKATIKKAVEDGKKIDTRYVFTWRGKPIFHVTTKAWYAACARVGEKDPALAIDPAFTFHDLRHTWASWHVMRGTPLPVLQQLGAWSSIDMVLRYAHLAPGYVANYAGNSSLSVGAISGTEASAVSEDSRADLYGVGWLMGLEPTTTGITILPSKKKAA